MAAGRVYETPGVRLEIVRGARDTQGALLEMAATYAPGSRPPPLHYHPEQEETFDVRSGALRFLVDGADRVVRAGDRLVVPARASHLAHNESQTDEAVVTWAVRPALETEALFAALYDLRARGRGALWQLLLLSRFRREFRLASIPGPVESCVLGLLAPLAKALGCGDAARSATTF